MFNNEMLLDSLTTPSVNSVAHSCVTLCDPMDLQHARLSCPSPIPRTCSNSCPLSLLIFLKFCSDFEETRYRKNIIENALRVWFMKERKQISSSGSTFKNRHMCACFFVLSQTTCFRLYCNEIGSGVNLQTEKAWILPN